MTQKRSKINLHLQAWNNMAPLLPLVLALVSLQKFPLGFKISKDIALCKMKMALPSQCHSRLDLVTFFCFKTENQNQVGSVVSFPASVYPGSNPTSDRSLACGLSFQSLPGLRFGGRNQKLFRLNWPLVNQRPMTEPVIGYNCQNTLPTAWVSPIGFFLPRLKLSIFSCFLFSVIAANFAVRGQGHFHVGVYSRGRFCTV